MNTLREPVIFQIDDSRSPTRRIEANIRVANERLGAKIEHVILLPQETASSVAETRQKIGSIIDERGFPPVILVDHDIGCFREGGQEVLLTGPDVVGMLREIDDRQTSLSAYSFTTTRREDVETDYRNAGVEMPRFISKRNEAAFGVILKHLHDREDVNFRDPNRIIKEGEGMPTKQRDRIIGMMDRLNKAIGPDTNPRPKKGQSLLEKIAKRFLG